MALWGSGAGFRRAGPQNRRAVFWKKPRCSQIVYPEASLGWKAPLHSFVPGKSVEWKAFLQPPAREPRAGGRGMDRYLNQQGLHRLRISTNPASSIAWR